MFACSRQQDIPGRNDASPVNAGDDPILATDSVEFHHQAVFVVVAQTRDAARRAAKLGKIEIESEQPLVSVDDALAAESYILPEYTFLTGEPDAALAASQHRVSGSLRIGGQEHFYLEGQVALAVPGEDEMLVYSSTQHPSELQAIIAHMLHLPAAAVTVEVRRMGGAFGGKEIPGRPMGGTGSARGARHRPALQAAARPRRRHGHDRQAA